MGKTLGLNDDYWHGLIPAITLSILIPVWYLLFAINVAHIMTLETVLVLIILHFINEWKEMIDPYLTLKYGSWQNFIINSKRDTKFFVIGLFVGLIIGFVIYGILVQLTGSHVAMVSPIPASKLPPNGL